MLLRHQPLQTVTTKDLRYKNCPCQLSANQSRLMNIFPLAITFLFNYQRFIGMIHHHMLTQIREILSTTYILCTYYVRTLIISKSSYITTSSSFPIVNQHSPLHNYSTFLDPYAKPFRSTHNFLHSYCIVCFLAC